KGRMGNRMIRNGLVAGFSIFVALLALGATQSEWWKTKLAVAVADTDHDGLSDSDETAIYGTNPNKFDSDGDGMGDGAEILAGTDPLNPLSIFRLLGSPIKLPGGGWRIAWSSVPGKNYTVQRSDLSNPTNWSMIAVVTASGPVSSFDDPASPDARRFYRVRVGPI